MSILIEPMKSTDWKAVRAIYQAGIDMRIATFETQAPADWDVWSSGKRPDCRFVARQAGGVVGWVALSPVSKRAVYGGVAEVSVYVASAAQGHGIGGRLLAYVVEASEAAGIWTMQASIFPENEASIAIHQKCGFRILGRRERVAQLDGVWRDTVLMERRSQTVGN